MRTIKNTLILLTLSILASCASVETDPTIGAWDLAMDTPVGAVTAVLTIVGDGSGSMASDMFPATPISDIVTEENSISFAVNVEAQGQSIDLAFSGLVVGDALDGTFDSPFGAIAVTGTRQ